MQVVWAGRGPVVANGGRDPGLTGHSCFRRGGRLAQRRPVPTAGPLCWVEQVRPRVPDHCMDLESRPERLGAAPPVEARPPSGGKQALLPTACLQPNGSCGSQPCGCGSVVATQKVACWESALRVGFGPHVAQGSWAEPGPDFLHLERRPAGLEPVQGRSQVPPPHPAVPASSRGWAATGSGQLGMRCAVLQVDPVATGSRLLGMRWAALQVDPAPTGQPPPAPQRRGQKGPAPTFLPSATSPRYAGLGNRVSRPTPHPKLTQQGLGT